MLILIFSLDPINQWSLATSALGGIIGIALLLLIVNHNHPSRSTREFIFSVPVLHSVRGRVTEVPVQANTPLKEGDALFRIDPKPYARHLRTQSRNGEAIIRRGPGHLAGRNRTEDDATCPEHATGRPRSFGARTEGGAQMGNEKEGARARFARSLLTKRPPDPLEIATASCPSPQVRGRTNFDAALATRSHDVAAGARAAAGHTGLGVSAAISSFLRVSSCSSRSMFWNSRSLVRRRK